MVPQTYLLTVLSCLTFFPYMPHAYKIDASCSGEYKKFVDDGITSAFTMASVAAGALTNRDSNINRLVKLLFCRPGEQPENKDMQTVINTFNNIVKMSRPSAAVSDKTTEAQNDVILYCNLDRLTKRKSDNRWVDLATNAAFENRKDHPLDDCKTGDSTLAFAYHPNYTSEQTTTGYAQTWYPSQVTICPWFLQWAMKQKYKTWADISTKAKVAGFTIPRATKGWPFTPIDAINLLDKVLLHELTHTFIADKLDDVTMQSGGAPFFNTAYGWRAATELARQGPTDEKKMPSNNADTLALFASGVRLLHESPVEYIRDNGDVSKDQPRKRDVSLRGIDNGATPVAFEGFITMIKESYAAASADPYYQEA